VSFLTTFCIVFGLFAISYFVALNGIYLGFTLLSWRGISRQRYRHSYTALEQAFASPLTPAVSVILPAYNEESLVGEAVHSLLGLNYPRLEVIVVNDGSTDRTLSFLQEEFDLAQIHHPLRTTLDHRRVRSTYISRRQPNLLVVDKENGGKADAQNCAINAASHPYICVVDADDNLEDDALLRVAQPFLDDPEHAVATGGIVRISNGCRIEDGIVRDVGLPKSRLATFQIVEYFRAFLVGRVAWSRLGSLLIISGAFGMFSRRVVEEVGGYWPQTVGEDAELVMRMQRYLRKQRKPYTIEFVPDPVCWTKAPDTFRGLARQRGRWARGLFESLWRHKRVLFNPTYGLFGLFAMPYFVAFELFGPVVEILSVILLPLTIALGLLSYTFLLAFLIAALMLGTFLAAAALLLQEFSFRRHVHHKEAVRLVLYSFLETFSYRLLVDLWRLLALVSVASGNRIWNTKLYAASETNYNGN
jgi:cellulose synthase/poly-beta-1,6-N-acetylglucosamine synthase-like glycosyltransferase